MRRFGGPGLQSATRAVVAADGSIWITGDFFETLAFGPAGSLRQGVSKTGYFARLDKDGNPTLAHRVAGGITTMHRIARMASGFAIAASVTGAISVDETRVPGSDDDQAGLLFAIDPAGKTRWVRRFSGPGLQRALSVVSDDSRLLVAGISEGPLHWLGSATPPPPLATRSDADIFWAWLTPDGELTGWSAAGGANAPWGFLGVALGAGGTGWLTSHFLGEVHIGQESVTSEAGEDFFVARLPAP
jgi:hypothetical protein